MGRYRTIIVYKDYFENFLNTQPSKVQRKILQILRVIEDVEVIPSKTPIAMIRKNSKLMRDYYKDKNNKEI